VEFQSLMSYLSELEGSVAWRNFCHPGASLLPTGEIAVQAEVRPVLSPGAVARPKALVQCRGAVIPKLGHDSRCRN
jgi:hypothetical protein